MAIHSGDTQNEYDFWVKNMHLSDINPVRCGRHKREAGGFWGPSIPDYYSLHYVLSGKGTVICGNKSEKLEKYHMFLIRPEEVIKHQADYEEPWMYSWISFEGKAAQTLLELCGFNENRHSVYCPEVYGIFDDIRRLSLYEEVPATYLCAKIYTIFDMLLKVNSPKTSDNPALQYCVKAEDYIKINYSSHITIEGISKNLGIDRRYFSRIFTKYIGVSPQKYLVNYRLEKAKNLLATGAYTVSEVASSVGYDDIFAFSKIFKKKYGMSPSKYSETDEQ